MKNRVITISREFGSGGRTIGKKVAEKLGIPCYDAEIIQEMTKETGFAPDYVKEAGEYAPGGFLSNAFSNRMFGPTNEDILWERQYKVITALAAKGPCVIVGRCGDYVLRDRKDVLRIFVYAPKEWRLAYGKENNMLQAKDEKGIKDEIDKTDRNRAAYYNYYTQNRWGDAHNYDLAINAALGHDACVNMILAAAEAKEKAMEG